MRNGFSLLEVLIAMSITLVIGTVVFQLFQQNEHVFHDQYLVTEMQQSARAAVSQSCDEIRMAGQGVPLYAVSYDAGPAEEAVAILAGSNSTRINFRAGLAPIATGVNSPSPIEFIVGTPVTLTVENVSGLYDALGGSPAGRFVYIWGDTGSSRWGWVRASVNSISPSMRSVRVVAQVSGSGATARFPKPPTMTLEEGIAIFHDAATGTMKRASASNLADPLDPIWGPANELATNVTLLNFDYFDKSGTPIVPNTLDNRSRVARVDIRFAVQTTQELSNHSRPSYALSVRSNIRSAAIR